MGREWNGCQSAERALESVGVLLVEDEESTREFLGTTLRKVAPRLHFGVDGRSGLELFVQHREEIGVVLSDIHMPEMDGIEMARRILSQKPSVQVIFLSAHTEPGLLEEAMATGARGYLLKPVDFRKMFAEIGEAVDAYHQLGQGAS